MKRYFALLIFGILTHPLLAQKYSLEKVLELALNHNHNIKVQQNNRQIAENNANIGNAGMLPNLNLNGGANYNNNNTELELLAQPQSVIIKQDGAESFNFNVGLGFNWTIFDGLAMFRNYEKLNLLVDLEDVKTRAGVEATLMQVISGYYQMASSVQQVRVTEQAILISNDRMLRAKGKFESGGSSSIDVMSAEVDLNSDSVAYVNALNSLAQTKNVLNQLTGYQLPQSFEIDLQVDLNEALLFDELKKEAAQNNAQVLNAAYSKIAAKKDKQIADAGYLPTIALNGQYGYAQQNNEIGNLLESKALGYQAGLTLTLPIFQSNQRRVRSHNAQIVYETQEQLHLNAIDQLNTDLNNAWSDYQTNQRILTMENRNAVNAQNNFDRTRALYRAGTVTNVQFREAQVNYLRAQINVINSKYKIRLSQFELIRLSGLLIKKQ